MLLNLVSKAEFQELYVIPLKYITSRYFPAIWNMQFDLNDSIPLYRYFISLHLDVSSAHCRWQLSILTSQSKTRDPISTVFYILTPVVWNMLKRQWKEDCFRIGLLLNICMFYVFYDNKHPFFEN